MIDNLNISPRRICVVALRVVRQLKRDRRTIGLITFAPILLMVLYGYTLSGEMSDVNLGLVDLGGHPELRSYLEEVNSKGVNTFKIRYLGSQSDAEKLINEGSLNGAVIIQPGQVEVLQDATSLQISDFVLAQVNAGLQKEGELAAKTTAETASGTAARDALNVRYIYGYDLEMIETIGPAVLALTIFFFTFIIAAISFLRERVQGSLEKFMVSPLSRLEMVSGYVLGFSVFTVIQSATTLAIVVLVFGVPMKGNPLLAFAVILLLGAGALVLGAFFSNFARTEFQVVQFIPIVIVPQILLCGIFWPLQSIPDSLRTISYILPTTYAVHAMRAIMLKGASINEILPDMLIMGAFFILMFTAATLMLRRNVE